MMSLVSWGQIFQSWIQGFTQKGRIKQMQPLSTAKILPIIHNILETVQNIITQT